MKKGKCVEYYYSSELYDANEVMKTLEKEKHEYENKYAEIEIELNEFGMYVGKLIFIEHFKDIAKEKNIKKKIEVQKSKEFIDELEENKNMKNNYVKKVKHKKDFEKEKFKKIKELQVTKSELEEARKKIIKAKQEFEKLEIEKKHKKKKEEKAKLEEVQKLKELDFAYQKAEIKKEKQNKEKIKKLPKERNKTVKEPKKSKLEKHYSMEKVYRPL